jgi:hypothetical protein
MVLLLRWFIMAIKAICSDASNTCHLLIGLSRQNIELLMRGEIFTLPRSAVSLSDDSDIALFFAETDNDLETRLLATVNERGR